MQNNYKKDYLTAIVAGIITVLFLRPLLINIEFGGGYFWAGLMVGVPVLWVVGLIIARFLKRWLAFTYQFGKFVVVGFLNTSIDFGVLNLLSIITGLTGGFLIGGVNIPGFSLAAINSYFWNKFWVFKKPKEESQKINYNELLTFIVVISLGVILNGTLVIFLTTYVSPFGGLSPERWLNISKVFATVISLVWNFVGFKFFVFKTKAQKETENTTNTTTTITTNQPQ